MGSQPSTPADPRPDAGFDGVVHGEFLAIEPERRLRGGPLDTTVTWSWSPRSAAPPGPGPRGPRHRLVLVPGDRGTDDPARQFAAKILGQGWRPASGPRSGPPGASLA